MNIRQEKEADLWKANINQKKRKWKLEAELKIQFIKLCQSFKSVSFETNRKDETPNEDWTLIPSAWHSLSINLITAIMMCLANALSITAYMIARRYSVAVSKKQSSIFIAPIPGNRVYSNNNKKIIYSDYFLHLYCYHHNVSPIVPPAFIRGLSIRVTFRELLTEQLSHDKNKVVG